MTVVRILEIMLCFCTRGRWQKNHPRVWRFFRLRAAGRPIPRLSFPVHVRRSRLEAGTMPIQNPPRSPRLSSAHAGRALLKRGKAAFAPAPRHSPHLPPPPTRTQRDLQVIARHQVRVHDDAPAVVASRAPSARGSATPHSRKARWFCRVTTTFGRSADAPGRGYERRDAARADRSCSRHS